MSRVSHPWLPPDGLFHQSCIGELHSVTWPSPYPCPHDQCSHCSLLSHFNLWKGAGSRLLAPYTDLAVNYGPGAGGGEEKNDKRERRVDPSVQEIKPQMKQQIFSEMIENNKNMNCIVYRPFADLGWNARIMEHLKNISITTVTWSEGPQLPQIMKRVILSSRVHPKQMQLVFQSWFISLADSWSWDSETESTAYIHLLGLHTRGALENQRRLTFLHHFNHLCEETEAVILHTELT